MSNITEEASLRRALAAERIAKTYLDLMRLGKAISGLRITSQSPEEFEKNELGALRQALRRLSDLAKQSSEDAVAVLGACGSSADNLPDTAFHKVAEALSGVDPGLASLAEGLDAFPLGEPIRIQRERVLQMASDAGGLLEAMRACGQGMRALLRL